MSIGVIRSVTLACSLLRQPPPLGFDLFHFAYLQAAMPIAIFDLLADAVFRARGMRFEHDLAS